jgi:hypothetical protein
VVDVCARILPGTIIPHASRVMAVVGNLCIQVLSHCGQISANASMRDLNKVTSSNYR